MAWNACQTQERGRQELVAEGGEEREEREQEDDQKPEENGGIE